jgi:hypothetical protein
LVHIVVKVHVFTFQDFVVHIVVKVHVFTFQDFVVHMMVTDTMMFLDHMVDQIIINVHSFSV